MPHRIAKGPASPGPVGAVSDAHTQSGAGARLARAFASPIGVLITLPALVTAVGIAILLVGRDATRSTSDQMARQMLASHATSVQSDVAFALDQADPVLARLRTLADPSRPADDILVRLHDLVVGRPGVAYASLSFPDGTFRGAYRDGARVAVQESRITAAGTDVQRFTVGGGPAAGGATSDAPNTPATDGADGNSPSAPAERTRPGLALLRREITDYDPRLRGFYKLAETTHARAWTAPYTFFATHETGITCAEPVYEDGALRAVLTVDFDVGALSQYIERPVLDHARSLVYTRDGTILAYPAAVEHAPAGDQLLRHQDLRDPAVEALFAAPPPGALQLSELATADGGYLAAVAPIGGRRAGVAVPLDWYVATLVPVRTLLGPTHALERSSVVASAIALAAAVALALVLAWNLVRMRRQVARSRAEARTAEARARELGSYRLVARLGAGGMGEVWRAEHRLLARSAAIKLIRSEAMQGQAPAAEIHARFRREAQTLASMRSRNTIEIFDYGVTELGVLYYVMELLDGLDLESLVARFGAQPAPRVIQLLIQACASLAEAHDAGLLHRDIKPPNLFICRAADEVDIVKLLDFGIVQTAGDAAPAPPTELVNETAAVDAGTPSATSAVASQPAAAAQLEPTDGKLTKLGALLGTPGFMPPEQILGGTLDGRADLYALGCCAWWLLTGREVFPRTASAPLLHRHLYDPIPSLAESVRGWCPPALVAVITSCLAKQPDQRPCDARTVAAMLRAIEIPTDLAWTPELAAAWWRVYQPATVADDNASTEVQVIMPGPTAQRPVAATSDTAIAQTIASPPPTGAGAANASSIVPLGPSAR